jgi:DNA-binding IclR family transcriptional regulator
MDDGASPAIKTVQRATLILNAFTVLHPRLSLGDLALVLSSTKPTAHRYAKALREAGLLRYDPVSMTYALGPQLLNLESVARSGLSIVAAAELHMAELLRTIDQTVILSVWDGETATVVRCLDNTSGVVRLSVKPGSRLDLFESAQGRVFCAFLAGAEIPGLDRRIRSSPQFEMQLEEIRDTGLSRNSPAVHGIHTLAAPVFEYGEITAALAVAGTAAIITDEVEQKLGDALLAAAANLSADLGTPLGKGPLHGRAAAESTA